LITNNANDLGKFKIPSLRNVALTAPYMHDGRFATLEDVMEHYSTGIEDSPNLDFRLRNIDGSAKRLNISEADKKAIVAFLNTLTDYQMIANPKFSSPFKVK
jgi:cytochrome c peroxidase